MKQYQEQDLNGITFAKTITEGFKKVDNLNGFTLTEFIVVIAIFAIVSGIFIPVYFSMKPTIRVNGAARGVMGDFMWARMRAISENNDYVIGFGSAGPDLSNDTYYIYDDDDNDFDTVGSETGELVKTVVIPDEYKGVGYGFVPNMDDVTGGTLNAGDPPVTFASSVAAGNIRWFNFEPTGRSNKSGTVYLILDEDVSSGRENRSRAITVLQSTGRVKLRRYKADTDNWE